MKLFLLEIRMIIRESLSGISPLALQALRQPHKFSKVKGLRKNPSELVWKFISENSGDISLEDAYDAVDKLNLSMNDAKELRRAVIMTDRYGFDDEAIATAERIFDRVR